MLTMALHGGTVIDNITFTQYVVTSYPPFFFFEQLYTKLTNFK